MTDLTYHRTDPALMQRREATGTAPYALGPTSMRYIATATVYRRATNAEIDRLEAWLDNRATTDQRVAWRDAPGGLMRVDEVLPLATLLFGTVRAGELLD